MAREIRISPDGDAVAIRSDNPEDSSTAWAYIHAVHGGGWVSTDQIAGWEAP